MHNLAVKYGEVSFLILAHYFALTLTATLAYLIGRRLTAHIKYQTKLEAICFSLGLGLGAIAYLIAILGLLKLLYTGVLAVALTLSAMLCWPIWRKWPQQLRGYSWRGLWQRWPIMICLGVALPLLLLPLYPPIAWDSIAQHLAAAKIFAQQHALIFTPYLRYPVFPQTNQMLFVGALLCYDDLLAQLIELLVLAILLATLIAFGKRHLSARAGWWGAALLLSSPLVIWVSSAAYVDTALMLYVFLSVYAFWNWSVAREQAWLVLAGVLMGLAIGTKYPALFFLLILVIIACVVSRGRERWRSPFIFGGYALLIASLWLARNFYHTRNPLFPFYYEIFAPFFGYGEWRPEYLGDLLSNPSTRGVERSLIGLLSLPWKLTFDGSAFEAEAQISPFYLVFLPITMIAAFRHRYARYLFALAVSYTLFWWANYQIVRYLLPALPFFCLATATALDLACQQLIRRRSFTVLGCALLIYPGWVYAARSVQYRGLIPANTIQRDDFISRSLPTYPMYQFLNRMNGRDYTVYSLYDENLFYFADGQLKGDWFGPARFGRILERLHDSRALYDELTGLGANYFLINSQRVEVKLPEDEFFKQHFRPVFKITKAMLYELSTHPSTDEELGERSTIGGDN